MADAKSTGSKQGSDNQITASNRWDTLKNVRRNAETRAKRCAKVTLPRLWVDEGSTSRSPGLSYCDTGPKCVNSLASKIALAWLPPNASICKLAPDPSAMQAVAQQAGVEQSDLESALSDVERAISNDLETSGIRSTLSEAAKHAIVTGNFLLYDPDDGMPKLYPLTSYVCDRDGLGNILEIITLDKIAPALLPDAIRASVVQQLTQQSGSDANVLSKDVDLYTWITRSDDGQNWNVVQEVAGVQIPETVGTYPIDACPWIPLAAPKALTDDYGEGLVYDFVGAFESLEALRKALRKGAAAMAKIILFLNPTSPMRERQLTEAETGAVIRGEAKDVTALQIQKAYDMNFVRAEADGIKQSLELIFGVRSAVQRPGERVTAYEIRTLTQELDDSLSGFMSMSGEQLLLPLIRRRLDKMSRAGQLPQLPKQLIKPRITVGIAALGRGHDLQKLMEFGEAAAQLVGQQEMATRLDSGEALARLAVASDISTKGLIKTDERLQQEQQNQAMQEGAVRAAPQLVQAAAQAQQPQIPNQ